MRRPESLLLLLAIACSESKQDADTCAKVPCDAAAPAIVVGTSQPGGFLPFSDGQSLRLYRGPQGGQHFYTDLLLTSAEPGDWDFAFTFTDDANGSVAGYTEDHLRACPCQTLAREIAVIVNEPEQITGTLSVTGTNRGGQTVSSTPVKLSVSL